MLIDTHAHIMLPQFDDDRAEVVQRAFDAGLGKIMNVGCSLEGTNQSIAYLDKHENVYGTAGIHPYDASDVTDELMAEYEVFFKKYKKLVAVGETGLDYHREGSLIEAQREGFKKHLELGKSLDLPVIIHCRDAQDDILELLDMFPGVRGVVHCFSYDLDYAKEIWKRGIFTSFTGIITYPNANAKHLAEVVKNAPEDMIMVETDCPYLAPQAYRSKRNEPAYVVEVAKKIAEFKAMSFEKAASLTTENALDLFKRLNN